MSVDLLLGTVKFSIFLRRDINSRAYYKTRHVGRIVIFYLNPSEIRSPEWGTRFPEKGITFLSCDIELSDKDAFCAPWKISR